MQPSLAGGLGTYRKSEDAPHQQGRLRDQQHEARPSAVGSRRKKSAHPRCADEGPLFPVTPVDLQPAAQPVTPPLEGEHNNDVARAAAFRPGAPPADGS